MTRKKQNPARRRNRRRMRRRRRKKSIATPIRRLCARENESMSVTVVGSVLLLYGDYRYVPCALRAAIPRYNTIYFNAVGIYTCGNVCKLASVMDRRRRTRQYNILRVYYMERFSGELTWRILIGVNYYVLACATPPYGLRALP